MSASASAAREALLDTITDCEGCEAAVDALIAAVRAESARRYPGRGGADVTTDESGTGLYDQGETGLRQPKSASADVEVALREDAALVIAAARSLAAMARVVSQWHGAIGSGPIEELDAELGELGRVARAFLAATEGASDD